jgi:hypothetical protein
MIEALVGTLADAKFIDMGLLPQDSQVRILFGPSRTSKSLIPYRVSFYSFKAARLRHFETIALTDKGQYVKGLEPSWGTEGARNPYSPEKQDRAIPMSAGQ